MSDCKRGGLPSERKRNKRTAKKYKETMSRSAIIESMETRGLNESVSRVTAGGTVLFDRNGRF